MIEPTHWLFFLLFFLKGSTANICTCEGAIIADHCYQLYDVPSYDYVTADETCQEEGGYLAHLTSVEQTSELVDYLKEVLTVPAMLGMIVANAETKKVALQCPNNDNNGLMESSVADYILADDFTDYEICSFITKDEYKMVFGFCNKTSQALCDRPIFGGDSCNVTMNCTLSSTISTMFTSTTENWMSSSEDWMSSTEVWVSTSELSTSFDVTTADRLSSSTTTNVTTTDGNTETLNVSTSQKTLTNSTSSSRNVTDAPNFTNSPNVTDVPPLVKTTMEIPNDHGLQTNAYPDSTTPPPVDTGSKWTTKTPSSSNDKECRKGGVWIWGWCIPWWLLAILGALLVLLLICCCIVMSMCCGRKKKAVQVDQEQPINKEEPLDVESKPEPIVNTYVDDEVVVPPAVATAIPVVSVMPIESKKPDISAPPPKVQHDDKSTMTEPMDPEVRIEKVVDEKIVEKEVVKYVYDNQPIFVPLPKPQSARKSDVLPLDISDEEEFIPLRDDSHPVVQKKKITIVPAPAIAVVRIPIPPKPKKKEMEWHYNNRSFSPISDTSEDVTPDSPTPGFRFTPTQKTAKPTKHPEAQKPIPPIMMDEPAPEDVIPRFTPKPRKTPTVVVTPTPPRNQGIPMVNKTPTKSRKPKFRPMGTNNADILKIATPTPQPPRGHSSVVDRPRRSSSAGNRTPPNLSHLATPNPPSRSPSPNSDGIPRSRGLAPRPNLPGSRSRSSDGNDSLMQSSSPMQQPINLRAPRGKLGGVAGNYANKPDGWKPWAGKPKTFTDNPGFLNYD